MFKKFFVFLFVAVNAFSLTWNAAQTLSDGVKSYDPQIALNSLGEAVVIWTQYVNGNYAIMGRYSDDYGTTFSSVVMISNPSQSATDPKVVIDEAGNAVAVWKYFDGSNFRIQESYKEAQQNWSTPAYLSPEKNNANIAEISMSADGKAVVVWERDNITKRTVIGERHSIDAGKNWSANETILTNVNIYSETPKIFVSNSNIAIAVWKEQCGNYMRIAERHSSDFGDNWSARSFISEDEAASVTPQIAGDDSGNVVVCWVENKFIVKMNRTADKGETWLGTPVTLSTETKFLQGLQISMNQAKVMVIWNKDYISDQATVAGRVSADYGQNWAPVIDISEVGKYIIRQTVSVNGLGNIIVAWLEYSDDHYKVIEKDSVDGLVWSSQVVMDGSVTDITKLFIATSADGNVIGAWNTYDSGKIVIKEATASF
ncbi:MAG: hypothetical protein AMS24_01545 [Chlamydiae bacterium SM23_39]|nr:MAG: hypothetical protein AMS24_01545 [Chlamydiae bacterium SM23_39]